jgi:signal transduction histidine kinase
MSKSSDSATQLAREMELTNEAIVGVDDLSEVLRRLAARAKELVGADYAALSTFDENGTVSRFVWAGIDDIAARKLGNPPVGRGLLGVLARRADRPLRLDDLQLDETFTGWPEGHPDMCAFLGVPIRAVGDTIGSVYMTRVRGSAAFSETEEVAASLLALQIAATVSTALARETQGRFVRLQEREQIAHDLHDGTIQSLYALGLEADAHLQTSTTDETREVLGAVVGRVNSIIRDIRSYIEMLEAASPASPPELVSDLAFVIRQIIPGGVDVVTNINAPTLHELKPRDVEDLIYIAREALSNAIRHGHPTKVAVDLRQTADATTLTVQDNGVGFDTEIVRRSMGTITLQTRAERLGAVLTILSVPGMGTTVRVAIPRSP